MDMLRTVICLCVLSLNYAHPTTTILPTLDLSLLYQNATEKGVTQPQLGELWLTMNKDQIAQNEPVQNNQYHLFTRENPTISQPLALNNPVLLRQTNFRASRRTVVLIHDWMESALADFNAVLIPAFLAAEDLNIIVVDWSAGANSLNYRAVIANTIAAGQAVAEFINWLNSEKSYTPDMYHIVGFGFGGHQAGIVGRNVIGDVAYITALDPAFVGWIAHPDRFNPFDGQYTEVIHTNYGINGFLADIGQVDFYPNGGISMPGCDSHSCDHARSYFYFAESITTGGFTGRQCVNYFAAITHMCDRLPGRLPMGGLQPKTGSRGVFLLETNAAPPFSIE